MRACVGRLDCFGLDLKQIRWSDVNLELTTLVERHLADDVIGFLVAYGFSKNDIIGARVSLFLWPRSSMRLL